MIIVTIFSRFSNFVLEREKKRRERERERWVNGDDGVMMRE